MAASDAAKIRSFFIGNLAPVILGLVNLLPVAVPYYKRAGACYSK